MLSTDDAQCHTRSEDQVTSPPAELTPPGNPAWPLVISIEGNIGVGKSTVMRGLKAAMLQCDVPNPEDVERDVVFIDEPVEEWKAHGFLERMYTEPASKPAFQHMVLMSLAGDLLKALARKPPPKLIITERSPWGNYHTFGKANLSGNDMKMYEFTWKRLIAGLPSDLNVRYIYLQAPVATLVARVQDRAREEEVGVPSEYLGCLDALHEEWLQTETWMQTVDASRGCAKVLDDVAHAINEWLEY